MRKILIAICTILSDVATFAIYEPGMPTIDPTWNDVHEAERQAFEHGQSAAEHMSDSDTWRTIDEQAKASQARSDAQHMRMEIEEREHRERMEAERAARNQQQENANAELVEMPVKLPSGWEVAHEDAIPLLIPDRKAQTPEETLEMEIASLQPEPYDGGRDEPGWCKYCGAHLLGVQRMCSRCKFNKPKRYIKWQAEEKEKAVKLKHAEQRLNAMRKSKQK